VRCALVKTHVQDAGVGKAKPSAVCGRVQVYKSV
jgi:hypothetical protein